MENNSDKKYICNEYKKLRKMTIEQQINYIKNHTVVLDSNVKHELEEINNFSSPLKKNKSINKNGN